MDNIESIVKNVIGNIADKREVVCVNIDEVWQEVLNDKELSHTQMVGMNSGIISVYVDSSVWLYHMKVKKK